MLLVIYIYAKFILGVLQKNNIEGIQVKVKYYTSMLLKC